MKPAEVRDGPVAELKAAKRHVAAAAYPLERAATACLRGELPDVWTGELAELAGAARRLQAGLGALAQRAMDLGVIE